MLLILTLSAGCLAGIAVANDGSVRLDSKDAATADGSARCGLHNGRIYGVLTGVEPNVILSPDSWSSDDEPKNWNAWLVDFDNALFANWMDAQSGEGQQTVRFRIADGSIQTDAGRFFSTDGSDSSKFTGAITRSLQKTLTAAPAMPVTKNPLKEIRYVATFMCDSKVLPRYGREQLGFMVVPAPEGDQIVVYKRTKDGRAPGIQILSDKGDGTINDLDLERFLEKSRAVDAAK
jgi:hypothetical protein